MLCFVLLFHYHGSGYFQLFINFNKPDPYLVFHQLGFIAFLQVYIGLGLWSSEMARRFKLLFRIRKIQGNFSLHLHALVEFFEKLKIKVNPNSSLIQNQSSNLKQCPQNAPYLNRSPPPTTTTISKSRSARLLNLQLPYPKNRRFPLNPQTIPADHQRNPSLLPISERRITSRVFTLIQMKLAAWKLYHRASIALVQQHVSISTIRLSVRR